MPSTLTSPHSRHIKCIIIVYTVYGISSAVFSSNKDIISVLYREVHDVVFVYSINKYEKEHFYLPKIEMTRWQRHNIIYLVEHFQFSQRLLLNSR